MKDTYDTNSIPARPPLPPIAIPIEFGPVAFLSLPDMTSGLPAGLSRPQTQRKRAAQIALRGPCVFSENRPKAQSALAASRAFL